MSSDAKVDVHVELWFPILIHISIIRMQLGSNLEDILFP